MPTALSATQYEPVEWSFHSAQFYPDPFNDLELDVLISGEEGRSWRVPAYWAGEGEWRVRFAPPAAGVYRFESLCSEPADRGLHGRTGTLAAASYAGDNPLLRHGPLRVAASGRMLEYADGTPFFWLGDTWWMALTRRLRWPDEFARLTADRVAKGFTVIQLVAGLYPDMPPTGLDPRGENEAGAPWEPDYARIRPAFFDMADLRLQWLVRAGLLPCILGSWGYYLPALGLEKMKQHWRYLVARWAALPVVWCLAGETAMAYYGSPQFGAGEDPAGTQAWGEIGAYVRHIDAHGRLVTAHPAVTSAARDQVAGEGALDFDMLQPSHGGYESAAKLVRSVCEGCERAPAMPVIVSEVNYEGIIHDASAEMQRLCVWLSFLCGAAGFTYGANGLWQLNRPEAPFGPSPHGANWGDTPWEEAYLLPGSAQVGLVRRLLERYPWWEFTLHPEWVEPSGAPEEVRAPFAAGIPGQVRLVYAYRPGFPWAAERRRILGIEPGVAYRAFYWNPRSGAEHDLGGVAAADDGSWPVPIEPTMQDWVLVLEA